MRGVRPVDFISSAGGGSNQLWTQESPNIRDDAENSDYFGWVLAAGNYNGDAFGELAISIVLEDVSDVQNAGAVYVMYGSATKGLSGIGDQLLTQETPNFRDFFGGSLASASGTGFAAEP